MSRYLLDATVVFAAVSGDRATLERLARLSVGEAAVPALVYGEALGAAAGAKASRIAENIALIGANLDVLPFDRAAAEAYGALSRKVEPKRRRMLDRLAAAQALAGEMTLVTLAPRDFEDIPGLRLESWAG